MSVGRRAVRGSVRVDPGAVPGTEPPRGGYPEVRRAANAFAVGIRCAGMPAERAGEVAAHYLAGQEKLALFQEALRTVTNSQFDAGHAGKQQLFSMGQMVYGQSRRSSVSGVLEEVAAKGGELVWNGVGLRAVMAVATWCLKHFGLEFDAGVLEKQIVEEAERLRGSMEEVRSQMSEVRSEKDEGGRMKVEATPGNDEVPNTKRTAELAARVEKFLVGKLESRAQAEELARDIAGLIVSVEAKPAKGQRKDTSARSELPESSLVNEPTGLDRFRKRNATAELRMALTGHQSIVKAVVVERLSRHTGFKALAEKFELTVDEVTDILTRMRGWVKRFTQYYENDWYWLDTAAKYHIPDPPKCEAEFKAAARVLTIV